MEGEPSAACSHRSSIDPVCTDPVPHIPRILMPVASEVDLHCTVTWELRGSTVPCHPFKQYPHSQRNGIS